MSKVVESGLAIYCLSIHYLFVLILSTTVMIAPIE